MSEEFKVLGEFDDDMSHLIPDEFRKELVNLEGLKDEYEKRRNSFEDNIKNLSLLDLSRYIANLIVKTKVTTKHLLFLINNRLKYKELKNQNIYTINSNDKTYEKLTSDLIFCFHYLLQKEASNLRLKSQKEKIMQSVIRLYTAQIHRKEIPEIEKRSLIRIYEKYNDILEDVYGITIVQLIDLLLVCNVFVLKNSRYRKNENYFLDVNPYIIELNDVINYIIKKDIMEIDIKKIQNIFRLFSCKMGDESKRIDSLIEETVFDRSIFIFNNDETKIFFPSFTNFYQKLNRILINCIKIKYSKKWEKFNNTIATYVEEETKNIIENEFNRIYHKNVFLDAKYEVDGLLIYKDIVLLFECKKRELKDSSLRGGILSIKTDVKNILKKAIEQLFIMTLILTNDLKFFYISLTYHTLK